MAAALPLAAAKAAGAVAGAVLWAVATPLHLLAKPLGALWGAIAAVSPFKAPAAAAAAPGVLGPATKALAGLQLLLASCWDQLGAWAVAVVAGLGGLLVLSPPAFDAGCRAVDNALVLLGRLCQPAVDAACGVLLPAFDLLARALQPALQQAAAALASAGRAASSGAKSLASSTSQLMRP
jgi:hypothetical protein